MGSGHDIVVVACAVQTSKAPASELTAWVQIAGNEVKWLCRGVEGGDESDVGVRVV